MIPFVAIGPSPDYPAEADVESGVDYDFGNLTGTLSGGGGPTAEEIADEVLDRILPGNHEISGSTGAHLLQVSEIYSKLFELENTLNEIVDHVNDELLAHTDIDAVTSQTVFVLEAGPPNDNSLVGAKAIFVSGGGEIGHSTVTVWDGDTLTMTVSPAPQYTVEVGDHVIVTLVGSTETVAAALRQI